ncbi:hypothetical protein P7D50_09590 [Enterococcus dongliensis]|uniref:hypothetical protein n=1 Tax=Enterococcus dongliensis TaxID=2559925 RepID=UPI00288E1D47|nr:hypothetical protein [Enterococcus dongliensis]MDT2648049.1 hypothetical protein [Enterococcus dongliensis]
MTTMRRIGVQINGKLVGSCDSISKVSSPLFKDILDPWIDIKGFVPEKPSLNKNQQIVFEQLCLIYDKQVYKSKMQAIYIFINEGMSEEFLMLDKKESDQVLAAYAEWGMKNDK